MRDQSRHARWRRTPATLLAAGVLGAGSVALGAAPALADDTPRPGPHTVVFTGTCAVGGLGYSKVQPTVEGDRATQLTVPAGTTVTIVNDVKKLTGPTPELSITGHDTVRLAGGSYARYQATSGPLSIGLDPHCPLGALGYRDYTPLTLNVTPKKPSGSPTGDDSDDSGRQHGGPPAAGTTGDGTPGAPGGHAGATPPARQPANGASPTVPGVHRPVARGAVPSEAAAPGAGSGTSGGGGETSGTALPAAPPAAAPQPAAETGPSGTTSVLALLAAVCLAGVGAAAVHTLLAKRRHGRVATA